MLKWLWYTLETVVYPPTVFVVIAIFSYSIWHDFVKRKQRLSWKHGLLLLLILPIVGIMRVGVIFRDDQPESGLLDILILLQIALMIAIMLITRGTRVFTGTVILLAIYITGSIVVYASFFMTGKI